MAKRTSDRSSHRLARTIFFSLPTIRRSLSSSTLRVRDNRIVFAMLDFLAFRSTESEVHIGHVLRQRLHASVLSRVPLAPVLHLLHPDSVHVHRGLDRHLQSHLPTHFLRHSFAQEPVGSNSPAHSSSVQLEDRLGHDVHQRSAVLLDSLRAYLLHADMQRFNQTSATHDLGLCRKVRRHPSEA